MQRASSNSGGYGLAGGKSYEFGQPKIDSYARLFTRAAQSQP